MSDNRALCLPRAKAPGFVPRRLVDKIRTVTGQSHVPSSRLVLRSPFCSVRLSPDPRAWDTDRPGQAWWSRFLPFAFLVGKGRRQCPKPKHHWKSLIPVDFTISILADPAQTPGHANIKINPLG